MDSPARRQPDAFRRLYESWYPEGNKPEVTFTIVTCAANEVIGEIHENAGDSRRTRGRDWMNPREEDPLSLKWLLALAPSDRSLPGEPT
jgi:putative SOS response-associated peptidase YedK